MRSAITASVAGMTEIASALIYVCQDLYGLFRLGTANAIVTAII